MWIERATRVLDDLIQVPGTRWRVGLDPLVGLIPGAGDAVTAALSLALFQRALRLGVPRVVVARMFLNVLLDFLVGLVPLVGDAADFLFKANRRNLELLRRYAAGPRRPNAGDWLMVTGVALVMAGLVAGTIVLGATLLGALWSLLPF